MAEMNTSQGLSKSRTVLGDLTNRLTKRRISEKEKNGIESFNINDKDLVKRTRVSPRPCTEINSLKGNVISSISKVSRGNRDPVNINTDSDDGECLKEKNVVSGSSEFDGGNKDIKIIGVIGEIGFSANDGVLKMDNIASQNDEGPNLTDVEGVKTANSIAIEPDGCGKLDLLKKSSIQENVVDLDRGNFVQYVNNEAKDELGESLPAETSKALSETDEAKTRLEDTQNDINSYKKDVDDCNVDGFVLSQSGSIDCTILPESQESRAFEADMSTELKNGDECAHMSDGTNPMNTCACSFCTKAGYIWLDLNYQDIKARVSAMKKSQKEAIILAERSCRGKATEKHGAERFTRDSKLESHLMHQWRSLFQHMSSTWEKEANQLEASLLPLNDLREKCKSKMETNNKKPPGKHEGSSRDL